MCTGVVYAQTQDNADNAITQTQDNADKAASQSQESSDKTVIQQQEITDNTIAQPQEDADNLIIKPKKISDKTIAQPITINGDNVEFNASINEATASGKVEVISQDSKLSCQKLVINTQTKECRAEGNVRLESAKGVIEGEKVFYNFNNKSGIIYDAHFMSNPFFGRAEKMEKISDSEFIARRNYVTTCSFDNPHYRMRSRKVDFYPGDKVDIRDMTMYFGKVPVLYLPQFGQRFKDLFMKLQISPGSKKDWGAYVLTAYRYDINNYLRGRLLLDVRSKLGVSEGFINTYDTKYYGKGDFKFYYTSEKRQVTNAALPGAPEHYQRFFARLRHKWDIDERSNFVAEYYKIADQRRKYEGSAVDFLRDYFQKEYERDAQPLTYALYHKSFDYSTLDFLMQKRTNHWFTQTEKFPEIKYSLPNVQVGNTNFYFNSNTTAGVYNRPNAATDGRDITVSRFDTLNKLSHPYKVFIFEFTPYVGSRQTGYDRTETRESHVVRTMFLSGADVSTKFYRIFDIKSNFLGMDINKLRHVITPTFGYTYNHTPTVPASNLKQIDEVDALAGSNSVAIVLSNKLQTKRNNISVDLVDFLVTTNYNYKPKTGENRGSSLQDFYFDLKILPYSWMRFEADATYKHSGAHEAVGFNKFTDANYDLYFDFGKERTVGLGQRYQLKGGNEITLSLNWRLNPKWRFSMYQRRNRGHDPTLVRGLREQEYTISRDLHCWQMDATFNKKKGEGSTIWLIFRLKAFPELEFGFDQSYHEPKTGSQVNP